MSEKPRGQRKVRIGCVVSDKMQKTVVVEVERLTAHPLYGKRIKRTKRYKAHDEYNQCRVGDIVKIMETRPLSKTKRWRVVEILQRADERRVVAEQEEPPLEETVREALPEAVPAEPEEGGL